MKNESNLKTNEAGAIEVLESYFGSDYWCLKHNGFEPYVIKAMREFAKMYAEHTILKSIGELYENRPLYKDSGLWQIRSDDMEDVLFQQGVNEDFEHFINRVNESDECKHGFRHGRDDGNIYCNDCDIFLGKLRDV